MEESIKNLTFETSDEVIVTVPMGVACQFSKFISDMIADLDTDANSSDKIPLPNVTGDVFRKVVEFWMLAADKPPYKAGDITEKTDLLDWQLKYCQLPIAINEDGDQGLVTNATETDTEILSEDERKQFNFIIQVMEAANYLDSQYLLNMLARAIAILLQGLDPPGMRKMLQMPPLTPEEEQSYRERITLV